MGLKKKTTSRFSLNKILWLSFCAHAILLSLLWYDYRENTDPFGNGKPGLIAVSLVGEPKQTMPVIPILKEGNITQDSAIAEPAADGEGDGSISNEKGNSILLSEIQNKIERAKFYPLVAKRQNIEGAPVVEFKIRNDGSVEYVKLKQTSGSPMLDEAAQKTVQKAAPFPAYAEPISLSIRYALGDKPY